MATRAQRRRALGYGIALLMLLALAWTWQRHRVSAPAGTTGTASVPMPVPAQGSQLQGVATVFDADTIGVQGVRLRLVGVDAPEYAQDCGAGDRNWHCGRESIAALRAHLSGRALDCRVVGNDRYQRGLARCRVDGGSGADDALNRWLVRNGWAVSYGEDYLAEERMAERDRTGLWRDAFERPSRWRRAHPRPQ